MGSKNFFLEALDGASLQDCKALSSVLDVKLGNTKDRLISQEQKEKLWQQLSYLGSNDLAYALRGFEGVDYAEIVRDACKVVGVPKIREASRSDSVEANEIALIDHLFQKIWDELSDNEREQILDKLKTTGWPSGAGPAGLLAAIMAGNMGGFATYQIAVIVANALARAVLGSGLAFATNATIAEGLSMFLGPIGWGSAGLWIVKKMADPNFKKTITGVVLTGTLRQAQKQRVRIGILGHGSVGKDSLVQAVFNLEMKNISPIPGSTKRVEQYTMPSEGRVTILNFPGYGDLQGSVNKEIENQIKNCTHIIYLMNGSEIPHKDEIEKYKKTMNSLNDQESSLLVLNKIDKADSDEIEQIVNETKSRVGLKTHPVTTVFKKEKNQKKYEQSVRDVQRWIDSVCTKKEIAPIFGSSDNIIPMRKT